MSKIKQRTVHNSKNILLNFVLEQTSSFEFFLKFYLNFVMVLLLTEYADKNYQIIRKKLLKDNYECLVTTEEINYSGIGSQSSEKIDKIIKQS